MADTPDLDLSEVAPDFADLFEDAPPILAAGSHPFLEGVVLSETTFLLTISMPLYLLGRVLFSLLMPVPGSKLPRRLFGITFAASSALLLLVLLEVYGGIPARSRWMLWRLHLGVNLVLVVLVLPYLCLKLIIRRMLHGWAALVLWPPIVLALAAWVYLFQKVGEAFPTTRGGGPGSLGGGGSVSSSVSQVLSLCLSRAGVFGVCLSALMSGIGAVTGLSLSLRRVLHVDDPAEIDETQRGLVHALQRLAKHSLRLRGVRRRLAATHEGARRRREAAAKTWSERRQQARRAVESGDWHSAASAVGAAATDLMPGLARQLFRTSSRAEARIELQAAIAEASALRAAVRREVGAFARLLDDDKRLRFERTRAWTDSL